MERDIIAINESDNVAVAMRDIPAGATFETASGPVRTLVRIPVGHKVATRAIPRGEPVVKYGHPIGLAAVDIEAGDWVHTHNIDAVG